MGVITQEKYFLKNFSGNIEDFEKEIGQKKFKDKIKLYRCVNKAGAS